MAELVSIFCVSERTMCLLIMPQIQHHICMGNYCYFLITSETEKATCSCIMIRNRLIIWFSHIFFMRPMRKWHHQNLRRFHFNHLKNASFLRLLRVMWPSLTVTFFYFSACECNHLTHFGLLLRPPTEDTGIHHAVPLRLITVCGCSISAFALILTAGFLIYRGKINGYD